QYYSNRLAKYRVPDRVQVSYVEFDYSNFLAQAKQELANLVTNLDMQVAQAYQQDPTNFLREMKATSLDDARTKVHDLRLKELQAQAARKKAGEFANPLYDMEPLKEENFEKVAKAQGLTVHVTAPFDRENGPKELEVAQEFTTRAF